MTWRPALWLVALSVIVVDQASKQWALQSLVQGEPRPLIGEWLSLELVFNSGAAFSLGGRFTWLLTVIAIVFTIGIVYFARRAQSRTAVLLAGLLLGGAIGNLIDRLAREPGFGQGHVVDMINYGNQFVGNIADIAIVGSASVAVLLGLLGKPILEPAKSADDSDTAALAEAARKRD